jgi:hypothetical protein
MSGALIYFRDGEYTQIGADNLSDITRYLLISGYTIDDVKRIEILN